MRARRRNARATLAARRAGRSAATTLAAGALAATLLHAPTPAKFALHPAAPGVAAASVDLPPADGATADDARWARHKKDDDKDIDKDKDKATPESEPEAEPATDAPADSPASTDPAAPPTEAPAPGDDAASTEAPAETIAPAADPPAPTDAAAAPPTAADPAAAAPDPTDAAVAPTPAAPADAPAPTDPAAEAPPANPDAAAAGAPTEAPPAPAASTPTPPPAPTAAPTAAASGGSPAVIDTVWIVGSEGAACHAEMDIGSPVLGVFPEGSEIGVIGRTIGDWQPVLCNGSPGYLRASSITWWPPAKADDASPEAAAAGDATPAAPAANDVSGKQVAKFALQYVGYPYVNAAEGPNAFDCSGFTMFVIKHTLGLDITHDMFVQYDMGTKVDRNDLQPGDLVFFQNTFKPGLTHVGIYIGGDQFVDAENEQTGVVVSSLDDDYYASRWYGAVRYP